MSVSIIHQVREAVVAHITRPGFELSAIGQCLMALPVNARRHPCMRYFIQFKLLNKLY